MENQSLRQVDIWALAKKIIQSNFL